MKEYKIITLTPTTQSTVKSMEGYIKSCETDLNKLAREGWKLVCTESIPQQEMSNLIIFMEREVSETRHLTREEEHSLENVISNSLDVYIEHDRIDLPNNKILSDPPSNNFTID